MMNEKKLPKYVERGVDRHGNVRHYYRRAGRRMRLHSDPGSREFLTEIACAVAATGTLRVHEAPPKGFVYFLALGAKVKIGTCGNVKARIKALSTGIPGKARVYYVTPGDRKLERELHEFFAEDRISGEWFQFSRPIKDWIATDEARRQRERGVTIQNKR